MAAATNDSETGTIYKTVGSAIPPPPPHEPILETRLTKRQTRKRL